MDIDHDVFFFDFGPISTDTLLGVTGWPKKNSTAVKCFSVGIQPLQPLFIFSDKGSISRGKKIYWEGRRSEIMIKHFEQIIFGEGRFRLYI